MIFIVTQRHNSSPLLLPFLALSNFYIHNVVNLFLAKLASFE